MGRTVLRNLGPGRIRDQLRTIALTTEDEANPTFRSAEAVMPSWPCQGADVGRAGVRRSGEILKARENGPTAVQREIGFGPDRSRTRWQDRSYIRCSFGAACS